MPTWTSTRRPRSLRGPKRTVMRTWRVGGTWPSGHGGEEPSREGAPWPQKAVNRGEQRDGLQCGVCRESWGGGPKPWGPSQCRARSD